MPPQVLFPVSLLLSSSWNNTVHSKRPPKQSPDGPTHLHPMKLRNAIEEIMQHRMHSQDITHLTYSGGGRNGPRCLRLAKVFGHFESFVRIHKSYGILTMRVGHSEDIVSFQVIPKTKIKHKVRLSYLEVGQPIKVFVSRQGIVHVFKILRRHHIVGSSPPSEYLLQSISATASTSWNDEKLTVQITATATWEEILIVNTYQPFLNWNVRQLMVGIFQADTTWDVQITVGTQISTTWFEFTRITNNATWNVYQLVNTTAQAIWDDDQLILTVDITAQALWNDIASLIKEQSVLFNVLVSAGLTAETSWDDSGPLGVLVRTLWNDLQDVTIQISTYWDYSVVSTSVNTLWNDQVALVASPFGTLWNVAGQCASEFIKADPCSPKIGGCPTTGLLPKITVCELIRDRQKYGYISRVVK